MKPVYLPVQTARRRWIPVVAIVITLSSALVVSADVRLPNIFGDNMVLQRDKPIRVWGWADAGEHPYGRSVGLVTRSVSEGRKRSLAYASGYDVRHYFLNSD